MQRPEPSLLTNHLLGDLGQILSPCGALQHEGVESLPLQSLLALKTRDLVNGQKVHFLPDSRGKGRPYPRKFPFLSLPVSDGMWLQPSLRRAVSSGRGCL